MNYFLRLNKSLIPLSLIIFILIPFFGFSFFVSLLGKIILLLFLVPILLFLLLFLGLDSYKSKFNTCRNCGAVSLGLSNNCMSCGANLVDINEKNRTGKNASESIIEIKAEEIK